MAKGNADLEDTGKISKIIKNGQNGLKEFLNEEITFAMKEIATLKTEFADLLVRFKKKIAIFVDT